MSALPTKLLVAVDGSDQGQAALRMGMELNRCTGAELHVVHVGLISPWTHPDTLSEKQYQRLKEEAEKRLDAEIERADARTVIARAHVRMGRADGEIIALSEELGADLVLMGNRGHGSIERILLGSDSESVVRHAPCSVMVVRDYAEADAR